MEKAFIVIPDVHGRTFWKSVKDICPTDIPIVFLGDYLDPYEFEGITPDEAIEVFKEIIDFAKDNPNVTLLLGNHDCTYRYGRNVCNCRCNDYRYWEIRDIFKDNANMFGIVKQIAAGGKNFLLSHAGVHPMWLKNNRYTKDDIPLFNEWSMESSEKHERFVNSLADVSYLRGGIYGTGSVVWSDIREYLSAFEPIGFEQIVGHTYIKEPVALHGGISCIDVQRVFFVGTDGVLRDYEIEKSIEYGK